ncbi:hypothetical protein BDY19DRAFT_917541 [Irpex rosettiformis]|uniref:Uncharacterized protein n=1 Tax=Irpex rosettiformis TaxID=378272 RepID=A0ACB8UGX6_9APHY|nr:hypothetical protein BDY19DRAFT_917541 [Irpex rosettiformis]
MSSYSRGSYDPAPNPAMPEKPPSAFVGHLKSAFCILLHSLLLACHAILVGVAQNGHPLHLVKNAWYTESFFYVLNFGPNAAGKAYLVLLLYYTQKLALRRNLHKKQKLTAIHDQATAWLGLGSAFPVLWDQFSTCVSPFYVVCIFLYLVGLFILGITMPILFSVGAVFNDEARYLNITTYLSDVGTSAQKLTNAFPVVNLLPLVDWDVSTLGWQDYVIYDIPNFVGFRPIQVTATRVNVRCSSLANATQSAGFNTTSGTFPFRIDPRIEEVNIAPTNRALYVLPLILRNGSGSDSSVAPPSTMIVASTMDIQDDVDLKRDSVIQLNPAIIPGTCMFQSECTQLSSIQLLACDVDFYEDKRDVVPQIGLTGESTTAPRKSGWMDWTLPAAPKDIALSLVNQFGTFSPLSNTVQKYHTAGGSFSRNYTFTMLESNLMDALRFDHEDTGVINLGQLEVTLQNAIAAVFWRASVRMAVEAQLPVNGPAQMSKSLGQPFRYSIQITFWPPIVGLAMSALLLVTSVILTRHAQPHSAEHAKLDTAGVLQLAWLMGSKSEMTTQNSTPRNSDFGGCDMSGCDIANRLRSTAKSADISKLREAGGKIPVEGWGCS